MSLKELKLIFPKISDAPNPSDRDAYFLFALHVAALWRDLSNREREIWWSVLVREECGEVLQLLAGLRTATTKLSMQCSKALLLIYLVYGTRSKTGVDVTAVVGVEEEEEEEEEEEVARCIIT